MATCDECNGWLNPALAADAAVRRGDTVLLIQRKHPPMQGAWALPGGFVDQGEDPLNAAVRELEEETGLKGTDPQLLMVMGDPLRDPRKHIVSVVYEIQVADDQTPTAGDDAADAKFWPIETVFSGQVELAGDHLEILTNWLQPNAPLKRSADSSDVVSRLEQTSDDDLGDGDDSEDTSGDQGDHGTASGVKF